MKKILTTLWASAMLLNTACSTPQQRNDQLTTFDIRVAELEENTKNAYECALTAQDHIDSIICTLDAKRDQKTRMDYAHNLVFHLLDSHTIALESVLWTQRYWKLKDDLNWLFEKWLNRWYSKKEFFSLIFDVNILVQKALLERDNSTPWIEQFPSEITV